MAETLDHLELVSPALRSKTWALTTSRSLAAVLEPAYWLRFTDHGLARHDRVQVIASARAPLPEVAELLILEARLSSFAKEVSFVILSQQKLEAADVFTNRQAAA